MRVAFYLRVSTDEQTVKNQRRDLEAVARQRGWTVAAIYDDSGISGAKGREHRRQYDQMLKDATRGKFDMVAAWSVDRLGRSLKDLVSFLEELQAAKLEMYLHQQAIDTSTPAGRALFGMLGVFAEFERSLIRERVKAGMTRARAAGKHIGRPKLDAGLRRRVRASKGSHAVVARQLGISVSSVRRIRAAD